MQISIFSLLAVALERFIAIRYPFAYEKYSNAWAVFITLTLVWVMAIGVSVVPFGWNLKSTYEGKCAFTTTIDMRYMVYFNFFACILGPLFAIAVIYAYIFVTVYKQLRIIASLSVGLPRWAVDSFALVLFMNTAFSMCEKQDTAL